MDMSETKRFFEQTGQLYEQYGKPLEAEHCGKYLAVHPDGQYLLDADREAAHNRALKELGKGYFLFKVGPKAVRRGPSSLVRRIVND